MKLEHFGTTLLFFLISYLIGSISWAVIFSKSLKNEDIREKGSKNAGATNALRNYGAKIGLLVFILDVAKPVLATLIAFLVVKFADTPWDGTILRIVPLGALIGHIFPIFFKFKGGKGASCMVGMFLVAHWMLVIFGMFYFVLVVLKTKKVSIGSILVPFILMIQYIIFIFIPGLNAPWASPFFRDLNQWWITLIVLLIGWIFIIWKHKDNIKRILNKTERELSFKKKTQ